MSRREAELLRRSAEALRAQGEHDGAAQIENAIIDTVRRDVTDTLAAAHEEAASPSAPTETEAAEQLRARAAPEPSPPQWPAS